MARTTTRHRCTPSRPCHTNRKVAAIIQRYYSGGGAPAPSLQLFQKHITNKWVDVVFSDGVYDEEGGALETTDFSVQLTSNGGASSISIASVKVADHYLSASASGLVGGESKIRLFISGTGTINGLEQLTISATVYNSDGKSRQVSFSPKLNVRPANCWDFREKSSVTVTGAGVSSVTDLMGVFNYAQSTDADRPAYVEATRAVFDRSNTEYLSGGDQSSFDFQENTSFTIVARAYKVSDGNQAYIIGNKGTSLGTANNRGWFLGFGQDGSLFFSLHDGSTQKFTDTNDFAGTPEWSLIAVNDGGTLNVYDDNNEVIGGPVSTDIGTIDYSDIVTEMGRRGLGPNFELNGYIVCIAVFTSALDETNRANVLAAIKPQVQQTLQVPATSLTNWNTEFASYKVGAFVSYGMTTYTASDSYATNKDITPPAASTFDPPSDILSRAATWINDIESTNKVDFYCLTSGHHIGFKIYPSQVELKQQAITDASLGSINIPVRSPYCHDQDILGAMVTAVKAHNKPVYIYFNIGRRVNERGSNIYGNDDFYYDFVRDSLKELIDLYNPDGFFLDGSQERPWADNAPGCYQHRLYNDLKNYKSTIKIIHNVATVSGSLLAGGNLNDFGQDAVCLERDIGRTLTDTDEYDVTIPKNHYGQDYYINVCDIIVTNTNIIYFGSEDKSATPRTQQAVQDLYDASKAVGVPLFINFSISQDGTLQSEQIDYLDNLTL